MADLQDLQLHWVSFVVQGPDQGAAPVAAGQLAGSHEFGERSLHTLKVGRGRQCRQPAPPTVPLWRPTLNSAIRIVAVTQARTPSSGGYACHQWTMAEGKASRDAMRCLKRQVFERLWRTMSDEYLTVLTSAIPDIA